LPGSPREGYARRRSATPPSLIGRWCTESGAEAYCSELGRSPDSLQPIFDPIVEKLSASATLGLPNLSSVRVTNRVASQYAVTTVGTSRVKNWQMR
jgi:hypothetical protein